MSDFRKADFVIIGIALFNFLARLLFFDNLEFHRDELLYFALGQHPALGYETVPPLIGWISFLLQAVFDHSVFAVRIFPALLSGVMVLLVASIARELGSTRYGSIVAVIGLSFAIFFMRSFFLFQPVHIEIFLWTLCIWLVLKYINTENDRYLVLFGIAAGFALLNKYLSGLFFAGFLLIIPFTQYRNAFRNRFFWVGMMAGFLIFLPNLIWQVSKGFPVFHHISALYDTQLVHMDIPTFLIDQVMSPYGVTILTLAGIIFLLSSAKMKRFRFMAFLSLFVIVSLMLLKGKGYYTLGVFPFMIAAGAAAFDNWLHGRFVRIALPALIVLINFPAIPIGLPVFEKEGLKKYFRYMDEEMGIDLGRRFEDGTIHSLPQDYADMIGWEELTMLTDKAYRMIDDKEAALVYGENYGQAGAIAVIGKKYGLPEPVSFHESFRYWFPREFKTEILSFIYINDELGEDIAQLFEEITIIGSISDPDAREFGTTVYLCEKPLRSFNEFWKERTRDL